jgi:hypothetical protein
MRTNLILGLVGVTAIAVAATARDARACGGCFQAPSPTQIGTVVTDHRMIFRVSPQATTLYDEIQYSGPAQSFAWVLPIHGQVEVGLSSDVVFAALDQNTQTTIVAPNLPPCPSNNCSCGGDLGGAGDFDASASPDAGAVQIISQQTVGPYDTVQLKSSDPAALATWLGANGYVIPTDVEPIVAAYVQEGFDFLALRLSPGQGVQAMRPVRVTSPGAGLSLPLRMVAAGTGTTVGITLWVVADGRYEPQNFASFVIAPSALVWDWSTQSSNYTTIRASREAQYKNAAWQIESSTDVSPYSIENQALYSGDYLPIPGTANSGDGGDGGDDAGGETSQQVAQDDMNALFPGGNLSSVRVTRMRADLSHTALASDLALQAAADQSVMSNFYQVTTSLNAPTCPPVVACPPCPPTLGSAFGGVGVGGSPLGGGGVFGAGASGGSANRAGGGSSASNGGCSSAPSVSGTSESGGNGTAGAELVVLALAAVGVARGWATQREREEERQRLRQRERGRRSP